MPKYEARPCGNSEDGDPKWCVYGEDHCFGPFTKIRALEVAAMLNEKGVAAEGSYSGPILAIEGGLITQSKGRSETVLHDASKLTTPMILTNIGDNVDIKYGKGGQGILTYGKIKKVER